MVDLDFHAADVGEGGARWQQAGEGRLTDDDGLRCHEIVGGLGLDFARAGGTREGGDFSIRIAGRKGIRRRGSPAYQQEQCERADGNGVD